MQDEESPRRASISVDEGPPARIPLRQARRYPCDGCIAHCCRYVAVEIERPRSHWQFDQIRWMLLHENVSVYVGSDRHWYVEFRTRCRALGDDYRCQIYEDRPDLCREYKVETCPRWTAGESHIVRFDSEPAFAAYLALPPGERPGARPSRRTRRPGRGRARSGASGPKRGRSPRR